MTSTFFGPAWPPGTFPRTPSTQRSTLRRHPSGWAFTQIKPRERRLMICRGIFESDTLPRAASIVHPDTGILTPTLKMAPGLVCEKGVNREESDTSTPFVALSQLWDEFQQLSSYRSEEHTSEL